MLKYHNYDREIAKFIQKRPYLFWFIKEPEQLSQEAVVEAVLNLGSWLDVQELFELFGIQQTAEIFRRKSREKRNNYRPEIKNYFEHYFNKYA